MIPSPQAVEPAHSHQRPIPSSNQRHDIELDYWVNKAGEQDEDLADNDKAEEAKDPSGVELPEEPGQPRSFMEEVEDWKVEEMSQLDQTTIDSQLTEELNKTDWLKLFAIRHVDAVEKEAIERGGWGRLDWAEFEVIVKKANAKRAESAYVDGQSVANLDFLSSWLEFCIP